MTTDEIRELAVWMVREMERNAGYTDHRQRDESLLFGALLGMAFRFRAVLEGNQLRERR
jgi:hypothetical protein